MADANTQSNQFNPNLPTRTITITGESSARMVQNTVRISRLEQRSIQIAMATPAVRDAGRRAMDRLQAALSALESELTQVEKEIEATNRNGNQRRTARVQRPTLSRNTQPSGGADNSKAGAQASTGSTPAKTRQPQKPQNDAGKGGKGGKGAQQPRQVQTPAAVNTATSSTSQPAPKDAPASQAAPTQAPTQHQKQAQVVEQQLDTHDANATPAASAGLQSL